MMRMTAKATTVIYMMNTAENAWLTLSRTGRVLVGQLPVMGVEDMEAIKHGSQARLWGS